MRSYELFMNGARYEDCTGDQLLRAAAIFRAEETNYLNYVYETQNHSFMSEVEGPTPERNAAQWVAGMRASIVKRNMDGLRSDYKLKIGNGDGSLLAGVAHSYSPTEHYFPFYGNGLQIMPQQDVFVLSSEVTTQTNTGEPVQLEATFATEVIYEALIEDDLENIEVNPPLEADSFI